MNSADYRNKIIGYKAVRSSVEENLLEARAKVKEHKKMVAQSTEALMKIQLVAKQTQAQLEYRISELVTLAMESIFPDPYKLRLIYETKRNKRKVVFFK